MSGTNIISPQDYVFGLEAEIARLRAQLDKTEAVVRAVEEWAKTTRVKLDHARGNRQEINLEKALIAYRERA